LRPAPADGRAGAILRDKRGAGGPHSLVSATKRAELITYLVTLVKPEETEGLLRETQQVCHSSQLRYVVRCTISAADRHGAN